MSVTDSPVVGAPPVHPEGQARPTRWSRSSRRTSWRARRRWGWPIGGLFHDRDDADRFVWMRGFGSMDERREALARLLRRAGLEGARPGRQRDHGRQRRRAAAPADRAAAPALACRTAGRRSGAEPAGDAWVVCRRPGCTTPGHGTCDWLAREVQPVTPAGARHERRHLAHRARREHLPRPAGPRRPRLRLDRHVRRPRVVRRRPRPLDRAAWLELEHPARRVITVPRPSASAPPPALTPPGGIVRDENGRGTETTPNVRDYPEFARLSSSERSASLRVREAAVRNSSDASEVRPARERRSPRTACHW